MSRGVSFRETGVYEKLCKAAASHIRLAGIGEIELLQRLSRYRSHADQFRLYYGTQLIDDKVLDSLQELADELRLVEQFEKLTQGERGNRIDGFPSENRQVLHTACRDFFGGEPLEPVSTALARSELEKLENFLRDLDAGEIRATDGRSFDTLIHIGIGGSDLGPRCLYEALRAYGKNGRAVRFIANVDPDDSARVLAGCDLRSSLIVIVSKSGTTLETRTNEALVRKALEVQGCEPAKHCIAVTAQDSPMDNPREYLAAFYIWDWIGGRFSSTSMVGCLTLGFALGYDKVRAFLAGAAAVDREAMVTDIRQNIPLLMALLGVWNHNFLGYPTLAIIPYSQPLHRFAAHIQQLDMESNGKSVRRNGVHVSDKTGPIIWGEPGTNGQHAFFQLLHQGTEIVPVEFIGFRNPQRLQDIELDGSSSQQKLLANMLAQQIALAQGRNASNPNRNFDGNRPSMLLLADALTPESYGALLATYEARTIFQGFLYDINSFDQEGVQLGKRLANRFLEVMRGKGGEEYLLEAGYLELLEDEL